MITCLTMITGNVFSQSSPCLSDSTMLHMKNFGVKGYKPKNGRESINLIQTRTDTDDADGVCPRTEEPSPYLRKYLEEQKNIFYRRQTKFGEHG